MKFMQKNKMYRVLKLILFLVFFSCKKTPQNQSDKINITSEVKVPNLLYGIDLNKYNIKTQKIKWGDSFGKILEDNGIDYPEVYKILQEIKGKVNVRKLATGKPYSLFFSNDSTLTPEYFVYHPDPKAYTLVHLKDSLYGDVIKKPIKKIEFEVSGMIKSSLYETMKNIGVNEEITYHLSDIYAWTIDFFRLQKGDKFKVIYTEKFVDDSISIGVDHVKAACFEHKGKTLYAFKYVTDPKKGIIDYFDENAKSLRRAFLRGPLKFNRITSRYNLRRRISYYGNRVRPHKGTDFAASVGTPILATANGTVIKSRYSRGNGNYVTIKHNNIYTTQYLHMKKRKAKIGQFVKQGDIIGWVGMTGNTSGPHVCYRFWKNGRQVDPFKQKLPDAKPISNDLMVKYSKDIIPIKTKLDCIKFNDNSKSEIAENKSKPYAKNSS